LGRERRDCDMAAFGLEEAAQRRFGSGASNAARRGYLDCRGAQVILPIKREVGELELEWLRTRKASFNAQRVAA
jgi:hypothetical protein